MRLKRITLGLGFGGFWYDEENLENDFRLFEANNQQNLLEKKALHVLEEQQKLISQQQKEIDKMKRDLNQLKLKMKSLIDGNDHQLATSKHLQ